MKRFTKLHQDLIEINLDTNEYIYEDNYYIGTFDPTDPYFADGARQRQKLAWNAFGKLEDGLELAVKNAKIFINDIQDGGDYAFACGIVSALKFIIDEETFKELNELLEKQTKWEQTRNNNNDNSGLFNPGDYNTGHDNAGRCNSGDDNSGNCNSGDDNSGIYNAGNENAGDYNSGNFNAGHFNSGNFNAGNFNSGNYNSGHFNAGNYNLGNWNSGNFSSGWWNSGSWNSCNYSSGFFCSKEPKAIIFNIETDMTVTEFKKSIYYRALMSVHFDLIEIIEGKLCKNSYKDACKKWWKAITPENKEIIKSMPNFNAEVFKEITGITIRNKKEG